MLGSLLKLLAALSGLPALISGWLQRRADQQQGARDQAATSTARSEAAEAAIAQAEASAPKTDSQVEERLRDGTF